MSTTERELPVERMTHLFEDAGTRGAAYAAPDGDFHDQSTIWPRLLIGDGAERHWIQQTYIELAG